MLHPRRFAAQSPDHAAVIMGRTGEVITYRMLDEEANRLAHLLRARGLKAGDHLAIVSETTSQSLAVGAGGKPGPPELGAAGDWPHASRRAGQGATRLWAKRTPQPRPALPA